MNIIFVCTGNTCRSPMAQGILQRLAPEWGVISRGIFVDPGSRTHPNTTRLLKEQLDIDLSEPARQLTDEDCQWADLVLTMTRSQADFVRNFTSCARVLPLGEFAGEFGEIPDPFGQSLPAYEETFDQLTRLIIRAAQRLRREGPEDPLDKNPFPDGDNQ